MICITQYYYVILLKNEKHTQKHVYQASYSQCQQYTFNKLNQINLNQYSKLKFFKNSKIKKSKAINMKYFEKNRKPIPFLEVWSRDDEEKWWIFGENTVSLWERWTDKTMNSQNEWGKTEKFFKKLSSKCKTRDFCDWNESRTSRHTKSPKTPKTKFEKFV